MEERRAGFTLVELLVVLGVVGLLVGIAAPSLGRVMARAQTTAALSQFAVDVAYARMLSVRSGSRVEVTFQGGCAAPRYGRFSADGYRITVRDPKPRVVRVASLRSDASGVCLESNNDRTLAFDSRGLLLPFENRRVWSRRGTVADTVIISVLGRIRRSF